jgi:hypothetical protein
VTLEVVEQFREEYASHYNLRECAMMVARIMYGSFIVIWFIPASVVEKLKSRVPRVIFKKYSVTKLVVAGSCIYRLRKPQEDMAFCTSLPIHGTPARLGPTKPDEHIDEDYPFIEQPSDDFFCPVTFELLLQPHLTSCCGKHLSAEAATRIQGEGGACPLCKTPHWSTMLSKHFQRQVKILRVLCLYEDRGCDWQGELSLFDSHTQSCPMRDAPLTTENLKMPAGGHTPSVMIETPVEHMTTPKTPQEALPQFGPPAEGKVYCVVVQ